MCDCVCQARLSLENAPTVKQVDGSIVMDASLCWDCMLGVHPTPGCAHCGAPVARDMQVCVASKCVEEEARFRSEMGLDEPPTPSDTGLRWCRCFANGKPAREPLSVLGVPTGRVWGDPAKRVAKRRERVARMVWPEARARAEERLKAWEATLKPGRVVRRHVRCGRDIHPTTWERLERVEQREAKENVKV